MAETTQNTKQIVQAPQAGETIVIKAMPGQDIVLSDAFEQVDPVLEGSTVLFAFDNGGKVIIDFADLGEVQIPNIVLADGTMLGVDEFLASVAGQKEAALGGENIEPAAGPAAGGTASGGVGSYEDGAGDTIDGVSKLGGLDPRNFTTITVDSLEASDAEVIPDNIPFTFENPIVQLDDDALGGNPGGLGDDADSLFATGTLGFSYGLDGVGSVLLSTTGLSLPTDFSASVSADGLEMIISQGDTDVLRITLNDSTSGQYSVEQLAAIDHPTPGASEENLQFTLGYQVTDADGDSAFGTLSINVDDDTPVLLGEGSGVETPGQGGDISYEGIPGPGEGGNSLVNGLGGPKGFGETFFAANDDGSIEINVTSIFPEGMNFFGQTYTKFWINNNGNITFDGPLGQFTPDQITGNYSNPMIAPFFADVDTTGGAVTPTPGGTSTGSNLVWYDFDQANGVITITWDDTGYFGSNTDKLNAFQLRIFDQGGGNFSFEFRYENIDWTTGDASGGTDGLGGTVARAGWTAGDGENFYELPQSGDQSAILGLEGTSNPSTTSDGNWVFNVINGQVVVGGGIDFVTVEEESVPVSPPDEGVIGINETDDNYLHTLPGTILDNANWGADGFGGATGFTINGTTFAAGVTVFWAQDGMFLGTTADGAAASLIVNADGTYTVTMLDNMLMGQDLQGEQIDTLATVSVIGIDGDGDPLNVPLVISVVDDMPAVSPDTDSVLEGGMATGNVVTDASAGDVGDSDTGADKSGADGWNSGTVAVVGVVAGDDVTVDTQNALAPVVGLYGTLTLNSDGSYTYQSNPNVIEAEDNAVDTF
uniref:nidogen-like domain-containing protein n=1 Tax=Desulfomicrobium escambiense TaxID=29503 RepID=UPI001B7F9BA9